MDGTQIRDKFNLSNDQFYEVSKDGGRHRVRQTFGQLVVEHAYPAQKLQLPFVSPRQTKNWIRNPLTTPYPVQDAVVETGGAIVPPTSLTVPIQHRDPL